MSSFNCRFKDYRWQLSMAKKKCEASASHGFEDQLEESGFSGVFLTSN